VGINIGASPSINADYRGAQETNTTVDPFIPIELHGILENSYGWGAEMKQWDDGGKFTNKKLPGLLKTYPVPLQAMNSLKISDIWQADNLQASFIVNASTLQFKILIYHHFFKISSFDIEKKPPLSAECSIILNHNSLAQQNIHFIEV